MRKEKKRIRLIALLLTLIILLAALPLTAFAEEETYVFDEIRDYLVQDTYVADDGYIGIPMSVCTYSKVKPSETDSNTTVIVYVIGIYVVPYNTIPGFILYAVLRFFFL